jgi:hypothetical protein
MVARLGLSKFVKGGNVMGKKLFAVFAVTTLLVSFEAGAQEKFTFITLSPRVGEVISLSEKNQFDLFKRIDHFVSAVIFSTGTNMYFAKVTIGDEGGAVRDTIFRCPLPLLVNMAERINHHDALAQGTYTSGQERTILYAEGRPFVMRVLENDNVHPAGSTRLTVSK